MQRPGYFILISFFSLLVLGCGIYIYFLSSSRAPQIEDTDSAQEMPVSEISSSENLPEIEEEKINNNEISHATSPEYGEVGDWLTIQGNGGKAKFSIAQETIDERDDVLQVEIFKAGSQHEWDIQAVQENILLTESFKHSMGAWIKGPIGSEITLSVEASDYHLIENKNVLLVGEWQKVIFEFITDEKEIRTAMHFSYPQNDSKTILIDDIRVETSQ